MREYLEKLRRQGELLVVDREVDPRFELAAVTDKVQRTLGKPVLFERVRGSAMPVATNLYGTRERLAGILEITGPGFCRQWNSKMSLRSSSGCFIESVPTPSDLETGSIGDLPLITYCEREVAPAITSAIFLAKEPDLGVHNLSFARAMYVSDGELRVGLAPNHDLAGYHKKAESQGKPLEAAILIGTQPEVFLAAVERVLYEVDELQVAAQLQGRPVELRSCRHIDLQVPIATEIVIEGRFLPNERRPGGPFGEFMGYYQPEGPKAIFEVLGVSWRSGAVFHSIISGSPEENLTSALSVAANIYQRVSGLLPGILEVACQPFRLHTVVQIKQQYEGHSRQVLLAAMGAEPTWCKVCTVVDEDVDLYNMDDVMWAFLTRARPDESVMVLPGIPSLLRDPQYKKTRGCVGIDATAPFARKADFERKRIPGAHDLDLSQYLKVET